MGQQTVSIAMKWRSLQIGAQTEIIALQSWFCSRKRVPKTDRHARAAHGLCRQGCMPKAKLVKKSHLSAWELLEYIEDGVGDHEYSR